MCSKKHEVPLNGFAKNESIAKGLDMKIDRAIFGNNYVNAMENLSRMDASLKDYDNVANDKESFLHTYFSSLRNQLDLYAEDFRLKFDKLIEEIRKNIDIYENKCKKTCKTIQIQKYDSVREESQNSANVLKSLTLDENAWKQIESSTKNKHFEIQDKLDELKNKII